MAVHDFITREDIEDAPDDPREAFAHLVGIAQRRLDAFTVELDNQDGYETLREKRHGFMNVVLSIAKSYEIEAFSDRDLPTLDQLQYDDHRAFQADLDHYLTQILVGSVRRGRRESVELPKPSKDKIRDYVVHIRKAIDALEMSDGARTRLHRRLSEFETALDKPRLPIGALTAFMLGLLAAPGDLADSYDAIAKLTQNVVRVVAEVKAAEDQDRRALPPQAPAALSPPRTRQPKPKLGSPFEELDDEIPF